MVTKNQRLNFVNAFLNYLTNLRPLASNTRSDRVFELYCYFRKVLELANRGKTPIPMKTPKGIFNPYLSSRPFTASYIKLLDHKSQPYDLFLNCKIKGKSGVEHSPDIVLRSAGSGEVLSIFECKKHSTSSLNLRYYREFIGYLQEMGLTKWGKARSYRSFIPELTPCIYTSSKANKSSHLFKAEYDFDVEDQL